MEFTDIFTIIYDLILFWMMALLYFTESLVLTFIPRRYRSKNLREEVALVTGAASGVGQLVAVKLASRGCTVVIWDINEGGDEWHSIICNQSILSRKLLSIEVSNKLFLISKKIFVLNFFLSCHKVESHKIKTQCLSIILELFFQLFNHFKI